jgi:serine/threonine-protein kinase
MDENDPEKRIADLERQLAEARGTGDPGTNQGSPPGWTPSPPPFDAGQPAPYPPPPPAGFPPPPVDWQNPAQQAPPSPWQSQPTAGSGSGRRAVIFVVAGIAVLVLVIAGIGAAIVFNSTKLFTVTAPTQAQSGGGLTTNTRSPTGSRSAPGRSPSSAAGPSASAPAGPTQLHTVDGLNGLFGTIRSKFGDTMGYELVLYPDYAVLTRDDPQNPRHKKEYLYRNGNWQDWGSESRASSFDFVADLAKFDVAAVIAQLNGAPQALGITDVKSTYLIIAGADGGAVHLSAYASSNIGDSGYIELNPDGSVKKLHPPS